MTPFCFISMLLLSYSLWLLFVQCIFMLLHQRYGSQLTKCVTNNIVKLIKFIIMIQLVTLLLISIRDALPFIKGHLLLPLNVYLLLPISSTYSKISRFCHLIHANFLSVYSSLFNNFRLNLLCFSCSTSFLLGLFHS